MPQLITGKAAKDCYYVKRSAIESSPLSPSEQEALDGVLLLLDNMVSGWFQNVESSVYVANRLLELGHAMVKG